MPESLEKLLVQVLSKLGRQKNAVEITTQQVEDIRSAISSTSTLKK